MEHLEELRERLIKSLVILAFFTLLSFFFTQYVLDLINQPVFASNTIAEQTESPLLDLTMDAEGRLSVASPELLDSLAPDAEIRITDGEGKELYQWSSKRRIGLQYIRPLDPILLHFKASLVIGLVLSLPFLLIQTWNFVAPGLLPEERRFAIPTIVSGCLLFPIGASFAWFMLSFMLSFAARFTPDQAIIFPDARAWLSFALTMMLAFGLVFELPLMVVLATRIGLISVDALVQKRKYIFVTILLVAGIITPPDGITMLMVTAPVYLLFELSLVVSRALERAAAKRQTKSPEPPEVRDHK